ncbi:MAG TPA: biotin-dependent carboxyltransferase family protein [Longimicrobiales bacterium]
MIRVARAGLLTTVQDTGRTGVQRHGLIGAGPMDAAAHRIANLLVGNDAGAAALEATMIGPALELAADVLLAIAGADLGASLDDRTLPTWAPVLARRGSVLAFGSARAGCRAYVAIAGGIDVPAVLGSRSTDLMAHIGGLEGRALRAGDALPLGTPGAAAARIRARLEVSPRGARAAGRSLLPPYAREPVVRILRGPEHGRFTTDSQRLLTDAVFEVSAQSNRMGIRLTGPELRLEGSYDLVSSPVGTGTIQVPPSGEPIVLMADHQTVGGYPRIGSVITVDVPLLAQAAPGTRLRFRDVGMAEAQSLYLERERNLRMFAESLRLHYS